MSPTSTTRARLIQAAEQLFAERGTEGASLREITRRAKANLAAVNYHFGSKEGLLRAVLEARIEPINERRLERLAALEASGDLSVEGLLEAFIRPPLDPAMRPSESFIQLMARIHHSEDPVVGEVMSQVFGPVAEAYLRALTALLPTIPRERVFQRMQFVIGAMIHSLFTKSSKECQVLTPPVQELDDEAYLAEFVTFCAAGLRHE